MTPATRPTVDRVYQNVLMDSTRWSAYAPRTGDIVITTSYKAGTTWMQGICAALVFQQPQPPVPQDELSPWFDAKFAPLEVVVAQLEQQQHRRYIKTHVPCDGIIYHPNVKYLFVGRDGPDVFMSFWNHWNNMNPDSVAQLNADNVHGGEPMPLPPADIRQAFDQWLCRSTFAWEKDGYPCWSHLWHAQSWWNVRHLDNLLFIHFNDLLADLDGEMRRIAAFLDIPVNEANWDALKRGVSFSEMKANASKMAPGATQGLWKDTANFFHQGKNRRYQQALTPAQIARYREIAAERLTPELNRWLEHGRAGSGG